MNLKNAIKTLTLLFSCFLFLTTASAQDSSKVEQPKEVKSLNKINLNLIGVSIEREQKIGKTTTLSFGAGILGSFIYSYSYEINPSTYQATNLKSNTDFKFFPVLYTGIKHYYNIETRIKKGKKTLNNSANYVGLEVLGVLPKLIDEDYSIDYQLNITPQWGFQRSISKKVNFEFAIGPTVAFTAEKKDYGVSGKIAFGFLL